MIPLPSQVLISAISLLRKKASTRREQNGYLRAKVYKIFEMPLLFQELFREKSKKDRCGGTQERKQMFENKERAEKQLLTLFTPVVLPPLNFIPYHLPAQKENYFSIHSQAGIICTVLPSMVSSSFSFSVMM